MFLDIKVSYSGSALRFERRDWTTGSSYDCPGWRICIFASRVSAPWGILLYWDTKNALGSAERRNAHCPMVIRQSNGRKKLKRFKNPPIYQYTSLMMQCLRGRCIHVVWSDSSGNVTRKLGRLQTSIACHIYARQSRAIRSALSIKDEGYRSKELIH